MTDRDMLELLERNKGTFLSGEWISSKLGVSRAAVWKAASKLKKEGYEIEAVRNKGYCLSQRSDIISLQGISKYLDPEYRDLKIRVYPVLESTNITARKFADEGEPEGLVVIASTQTGGKGRRGRAFFSPAGTGLYMSLLLRPTRLPSAKAVSLTTMAAVAACEAIERITRIQPSIKWVNDIYVHGKKACGILTEASLDLENDRLNYAVLGIGFNVYRPADGFPDEIKHVAGAILDKPEPDCKNRLAAEFLNVFMRLYGEKDGTSYVQRYKKLCFVPGNEILVLRGDEKIEAYAMDIDDECRLKVRYGDGKVEYLSFGEISVRIL